MSETIFTVDEIQLLTFALNILMRQESNLNLEYYFGVNKEFREEKIKKHFDYMDQMSEIKEKLGKLHNEIINAPTQLYCVDCANMFPVTELRGMKGSHSCNFRCFPCYGKRFPRPI